MEVPNAGKHATQGRESGTSFIQRVWRTTVIIGVSIMEGYDRPPAASTGRRRAAAAITGSGPIPASAALGVGPIVGPFRGLSTGVGGRCREAFGPGAFGSPWGKGRCQLAQAHQPKEPAVCCWIPSPSPSPTLGGPSGAEGWAPETDAARPRLAGARSEAVWNSSEERWEVAAESALVAWVGSLPAS